MEKVFKKVWIFSLFVCSLVSCFALASCSNDDGDEPGGGSNSIVGTWVDGNIVLTLGKDGSYREDINDSFGQYRIGSYSYNPRTSLMVVDIKAIEGNNGAYQDTFIVQTLTSTTLVLIYADGDVKGYYTRK